VFTLKTNLLKLRSLSNPMNTQTHSIAVTANRRLRLQQLILRMMALMSLPVMVAVIAPHLTVEKLSWLVGFGQPPQTPLLPYLAAGGSFVYLILSAILWILSSDVARYRPLIFFTAYVCLLGIPVYWWIDTHTGMPLWWLLMDQVICFIAGSGLLWTSRSPKAVSIA
jgi:hypothetical protein